MPQAIESTGLLQPFEEASLELVARQAQATRDFVLSQRDEWRALPWLAREAVRKDVDYIDTETIAESGIVRIDNSMLEDDYRTRSLSGLGGIFVHCYSAKIILLEDRLPKNIDEVLASDREVFHLWARRAALGSLSVLSAKSYADSIRKELDEAEFEKWPTAKHQRRVYWRHEATTGR